VATPRHALRHALDSSTAGLPTGSLQSAGASRPGFRARLRSGLVLGVAAGACAGLITVPGIAAADPGPADLTRMVADAGHQLEVISEQVNQARIQADQQHASADQADKAAAEAQSRVDGMTSQVKQIARSAYTTGDVSRLNAMLTSRSAKDFVAQMGTLDAIAGHQSSVLSQVTATAKAAEKARIRADQAAADATKTLADVSAKQSQLSAQIADYKKQYAALTAPQQQAVTVAAAGRAVTAPAAPVAAPGQGAQAAVNTALAQVGKPYVYGASGPNAFDCSGLTMYAWAAAGRALPHNAAAQMGMGTPVSRDQLQPGDLVFFYSPVSHVGMYIGNGQMVHASTEGVPVQVVNLGSMPNYTGATRIG
jgi:cell wall-associated NlpC family hydrolase